MTLYLDIETIPPALTDEEIGELKIDKRLKDPDKVAAAREAAHRKLSTDPWQARVLVVGWAWGDEPAQVDTLSGFGADLAAHDDIGPVVTFNGDGFDLPILWSCFARAGDDRSGRRVGQWLSPHKPWESVSVDLMRRLTIWGAFGKSSPSLDRACRIVGVESPKGEMTGADVYDYHLAGRTEEIKAYAGRDVEALRALYKRLIALGRV